jgi:hypothetical protein
MNAIRSSRLRNVVQAALDKHSLEQKLDSQETYGQFVSNVG